MSKEEFFRYGKLSANRYRRCNPIRIRIGKTKAFKGGGTTKNDFTSAFVSRVFEECQTYPPDDEMVVINSMNHPIKSVLSIHIGF